MLDYKYHILIHQIGGNPILCQEVDPVYWFFMIVDLPNFISIRFPFLFDLVLVTSCICSILWPRQNYSTIAFFVLHFIYFVLYNMLAGHHYINIGLLVMSFSFAFSSNKSVAFAFTFTRFMFCFMMLTASLWKIGRGNLLYTDQLTALLLPSYIKNVITGSATLRTLTVAWLMHHRYWCHAIWIGLIFLEGLFVFGFLSFAYDFLLLVSYLLFFIGGWFLLDIYNYDNLLFLLTLTPILQGIISIKRVAINSFRVSIKKY